MSTARRIRVLFISHSAARNGASILLLNFLRWLRERVDWEFQIVVHGQGPLLSDFQSLGRTVIWRDGYQLGSITPARWRAGIERLFESTYRGVFASGQAFDLIYANTAASWRQVGALADRAPAILWHIHELEYGIRKSIGMGAGAEALSHGTRFVAVSRAVRDTLIQQFGVPVEKLDLVHGFVPAPRFSEEQHRSKRRQVRAMLGFEDDAFVVGACGSMGWRKGSDLFPLIMRAVVDMPGQDRTRFVWVGGDPHDEAGWEFAYDLARLGVADRCRHVGALPNVLDFYCAMDLLALPSREDPFPLVMLEAASCGVPLVCFEGAGGGGEFAKLSGGGRTVRYGDVVAFAAQLAELSEQSEARDRLGKLSLNAVTRNFSIDSQGPKLRLAMENAIREGRYHGKSE